MGHYGDGINWDKAQHEEKMKKQYTGWIIEQLEDKTSVQLRDIHTLIKHINEIRNLVTLAKELTN